jgi:Ca-activated chloride channel family protein
MTFAGLPLATLLGVGAVAGALTVLLYVLKLRRRPVAVPFSPIWQRVLRDKEASEWFARLKRLLSLLLQLLLLALLVFALGDPRPSAAVDEARHVVVLVDASASMKATDAAPSRLVAAKALVGELIDGLGGADRMLIAEMNARSTPLSTMSSDVSELNEALDRVSATDTRAELGRALSFALDSLRGLSRPSIVIVGDGGYGDLDGALRGLDTRGVELSYVPVGERGENVAITAFSARRYPLDKSRYEVLLEVANTGEVAREVELTLLGDGNVVDVTRLSVGAGEQMTRVYADLGGASRRLEARVRTPSGADVLPADDVAYAVMPERRRARILVVTSGNTYLEAALLLDEYLEVTTVEPGEYPPSEAFDVTIFDGVSPRRVSRTGAALYLNAPEGGPVILGRRIEAFGFDTWDKKSPLLRWIAPENVQVAHGRALEPAKADRVVGASADGPIVVTGRRDEGPFVALGFDPRDSDIVLRIAWPLLLLNTIDSFVSEASDYVSSYRTGDVWHVPVGAAASARVSGPDGAEITVPVEDGRAVVRGELAGFYRLTADGDESSSYVFAGNLADLQESRVAPIKALPLGGREATRPAGFEAGARREVWALLLLAALALSLFEWASYHRRVTV